MDQPDTSSNDQKMETIRKTITIQNRCQEYSTATTRKQTQKQGWRIIKEFRRVK